MKKVIVMLSIAVLFIAASCNSKSPDAQKPPAMKESTAQVYYTCPMHPEVQSDQPGSCPKCGMELVKKEGTMSDSTDMQGHSDIK